MKKGFTLIEIVIVLAVIAAIAAFLSPRIWEYTEKSRAVRAANGCRTLAEAILSFEKDLRTFPVYSTTPLSIANATLNVLFTDGNEGTPSGGAGTQDWVSGNRDHLRNHLEKGLTSGGQPYPRASLFRWKGPYHSDFHADPWGSRYYVNASHFYSSGNNAVWVLSAGPNGLIEANFTQSAAGSAPPALGGDDIGYRIK